MQNILIISDMEGIIGIEDMNNIFQCQQLMQTELSIIIDTLNELSDCKVFVVDSHNFGDNLNPIKNKKNVCVYSCLWNIDYKIKYDFAIIHGFHAKAGSNGFLAHTFRPEITNIFLDNDSIGEIQIILNELSFHNIPIALISADAVAIREIEDLKIKTFCTSGFDIEISQKYYDLKQSIVSAINEEPQFLKYNTNEVKIEFCNENFLLFFPNELYRKTSKYLIFDNTQALIRELEYFPQILNTGGYFINRRINCILQLLRENSRNPKDLPNVLKEKFYLFEKDINKLTLLEIIEIERELYNWINEKLI